MNLANELTLHEFSLAPLIKSPSGVQEADIIGLIPIRDSDFFFVTNLWHADCIFHIFSFPSLK